MNIFHPAKTHAAGAFSEYIGSSFQHIHNTLQPRVGLIMAKPSPLLKTGTIGIEIEHELFTKTLRKATCHYLNIKDHN